MQVDWSVFILNDRRQSDLPVPFFFFSFKRTFQNPAVRNALMKLPLSRSPNSPEASPHGTFTAPGQDELRAQEDPQSSTTTRGGAGCSEPAIREGRKVRSYGSCSGRLPVTSHPSASPTPGDPASQLPCEVGNYRSLPCRRRKWGVRSLRCSPGVPREVCGKAEGEFNPRV